MIRISLSDRYTVLFFCFIQFKDYDYLTCNYNSEYFSVDMQLKQQHRRAVCGLLHSRYHLKWQTWQYSWNITVLVL